MDYGVQIFTGEPDQPYTELGTVAAKQDDGNIEDVGHVLIEQAARLGANAIINVSYERKATWSSFNQLSAVGTAVILESDEIECPSCAEFIKSKAKKCRFCGEVL